MKFLRPIVLVNIFLMIGCSLNLPVATLESERDFAGKFDGNWVLQTNSKIGNCQENFTRAYMNVKNGIGNFSTNGTGYISASGDFKIETASYYGTSSQVYGGNLAKSKGRVIIDFKSSNLTDCSIALSIYKTK